MARSGRALVGVRRALCLFASSLLQSLRAIGGHRSRVCGVQPGHEGFLRSETFSALHAKNRGGVSHLKLAFRVLCPRRLQLCELALEYLTLDGLAFLLEPMGRL